MDFWKYGNFWWIKEMSDKMASITELGPNRISQQCIFAFTYDQRIFKILT